MSSDPTNSTSSHTPEQKEVGPYTTLMNLGPSRRLGKRGRGGVGILLNVVGPPVSPSSMNTGERMTEVKKHLLEKESPTMSNNNNTIPTDSLRAAVTRVPRGPYSRLMQSYRRHEQHPHLQNYPISSSSSSDDNRNNNNQYESIVDGGDDYEEEEPLDESQTETLVTHHHPSNSSSRMIDYSLTTRQSVPSSVILRPTYEVEIGNTSDSIVPTQPLPTTTLDSNTLSIPSSTLTPVSTKNHLPLTHTMDIPLSLHSLVNHHPGYKQQQQDQPTISHDKSTTIPYDSSTIPIPRTNLPQQQQEHDTVLHSPTYTTTTTAMPTYTTTHNFKKSWILHPPSSSPSRVHSPTHFKQNSTSPMIPCHHHHHHHPSSIEQNSTTPMIQIHNPSHLKLNPTTPIRMTTTATTTTPLSTTTSSFLGPMIVTQHPPTTTISYNSLHNPKQVEFITGNNNNNNSTYRIPSYINHNIKGTTTTPAVNNTNHDVIHNNYPPTIITSNNTHTTTTTITGSSTHPNQNRETTKTKTTSRSTPIPRLANIFTPRYIESSIPSHASSVFHIFDRRIQMDSFSSDNTTSMYSLVRAWVQDDPCRVIPPPPLDIHSMDTNIHHDYLELNKKDIPVYNNSTTTLGDDSSSSATTYSIWDVIPNNEDHPTLSNLDTTTSSCSSIPTWESLQREHVQRAKQIQKKKKQEDHKRMQHVSKKFSIINYK